MSLASAINRPNDGTGINLGFTQASHPSERKESVWKDRLVTVGSFAAILAFDAVVFAAFFFGCIALKPAIGATLAILAGTGIAIGVGVVLGATVYGIYSVIKRLSEQKTLSPFFVRNEPNQIRRNHEDAVLGIIWNQLADKLHLEDNEIPSNINEIRTWLKNPANENRIKQFTQLNLEGMDLTALPKEIGCLTGLKTLNLRDNQLTSLPTSIGNLTSLEELYLQNNQLTSFPTSIGSLKNLVRVSFEKNPLTHIPHNISEAQQLRIIGQVDICEIPSVKSNRQQGLERISFQRLKGG